MAFIPIALTVLGTALKAALPIFLPALMNRLEKKLPAKGDGPKRSAAIERAVRALALSLENDGLLSATEREELFRQAVTVVEAFVPVMNAQREAAGVSAARVQISGGYLEIAL